MHLYLKKKSDKNLQKSTIQRKTDDSMTTFWSELFKSALPQLYGQV